MFGREQVRKFNGQAIADIGAQNQGPRSLIGAELDLAGLELVIAAFAGLLATSIRTDHVATQGEDHALRVRRAQAIKHKRLIQGDHAGLDLALAKRGFGPGEKGYGLGPNRQYTYDNTFHDLLLVSHCLPTRADPWGEIFRRP